MPDAPEPKRGRPKRSDVKFTPDVMEQIQVMWLRGDSFLKIAREIGTTRQAVWYRVKTSCRKEWSKRMEKRLADEVARVDNLMSHAWDQLLKSKNPDKQISEETINGPNGETVKHVTKRSRQKENPTWGQLILGCIQLRAKLLGVERPAKAQIRHRHDVSGGLRVAGIDPSVLDEAMVKRLQAISDKMEAKKGKPSHAITTDQRIDATPDDEGERADDGGGGVVDA